jgi:hypothetical protein
MNENVHERFWGFFNPERQSTTEISHCILTKLNSIFSADSNNIIAQTFDGGAGVLLMVCSLKLKKVFLWLTVSIVTITN